MIVYRFKNIKTGIVYDDVLSLKDIKRLLLNKNIIMKPLRSVKK